MNHSALEACFAQHQNLVWNSLKCPGLSEALTSKHNSPCFFKDTNEGNSNKIHSHNTCVFKTWKKYDDSGQRFLIKFGDTPIELFLEFFRITNTWCSQRICGLVDTWNLLGSRTQNWMYSRSGSCTHYIFILILREDVNLFNPLTLFPGKVKNTSQG